MSMDDEWGRLVEKAVYIEPRAFEFLSVLIGTILIIFSIHIVLFMGIIIGLFPHTWFWSAILLMIIILIFIGYAIGETRYAFKVRNGKLDWDLYENGIVIRKWKSLIETYPEDVHIVKEGAPIGFRQLEETFIGFDRISRTFLSGDLAHEDECKRLIIDYHSKLRKHKGGLTKDELKILNEAARRITQSSILLEDNEGHLICEPIEKKNLRDSNSFEKFIRRKVRTVE